MLLNKLLIKNTAFRIYKLRLVGHYKISTTTCFLGDHFQLPPYFAHGNRCYQVPQFSGMLRNRDSIFHFILFYLIWFASSYLFIFRKVLKYKSKKNNYNTKTSLLYKDSVDFNVEFFDRFFHWDNIFKFVENMILKNWKYDLW